MDDPLIEEVPESLRYENGQYIPERVSRSRAAPPSLRTLRILVRTLHGIHAPFFAVHVPRGTGVLTTIGRRSGKPRRIYVKAARDGDRAYLVSIGGENALWLKNIRADPRVRIRLPGATFTGIARDLRDDAERRAAYIALCDRIHPFDYLENMAHRRGRPNRTKIKELHRAWFAGGTPLVIDLQHRVG